MQPAIDRLSWTPCVPHLICPLCGEWFRLNGRSLRCPQNHTFDLAKENYVNLIPGGTKMPKFPGDSKTMLQARRRFLDAGHYQPLVDALLEMMRGLDIDYTNKSETAVLDAGCGEGYYLEQIQQGLGLKPCYYGVDLSKDAIRMAAKKVRNGRFVVADIKKQIPLADNSTHLLLNIFAPRNPDEFSRLLCAGGHLLVVIPQADHLQALRQEFGLLNIQPAKQAFIEQQFAPTFHLESVENINFPLNLQAESLLNLIQMMPASRHLTEKELTQIGTKAVETYASMILMVFNHCN